MGNTSQDFLDKLAESQNDPGLSKSLENQIIVPPNTLDFVQLMQLVKDKNLAPFRTITLDLSVAQSTPKQIAGSGAAFYVSSATDDTATVTLIFSNQNSDSISVNRDYGIDLPFSALYATWSAQAGKTMTIMIIPVSQLVNVRNNKKVSSLSTIDDLRGFSILPALGTQVNASGSVIASAVDNDFYTVTAGKTLIVSDFFGALGDATASTVVGLAVKNGAGTIQYYLRAWIGGLISGMSYSQGNPSKYLAIPATYKISIVRNGSSGNGFGSISGYEV